MIEKNWEQFISTGKIEDYLSYKMAQQELEIKKEGQSVKKRESGAQGSESNCSNGNGAFGNTCWRI
ncbi:MAG: hypothetical protein IAA25_00315 [Candidatus Ruminococcus intestinipullorum]|nr:hypothetical protein [Candidatus Ruminococcus intestinipullorum]